MKSDFPRCETCCHWKKSIGDDQYRSCWLLSHSVAQTKFRLMHRSVSFVVDYWRPVGAELAQHSAHTSADFGCVLHEEKTDA